MVSTHKFHVFFLIFALITLSGCTILSSPFSGSKFNDKLNTSNISSPKIITASYYGYDCMGNKTANGEKFNPYALTAAHKSLPFGTRLKLKNPKNNKIITVRINDRGPYISGREMDLSYGAAMELGVLKEGVCKLEVVRE